MEFKKSEIILWMKRILPVLLGAVGGYLYYSFIGCATGTCAITSHPWSSTIVGAIIGAGFIPKKGKPKDSIVGEK